MKTWGVWKTVSVILGSLILIFLLTFCLVPVKTVSYQVTVQKQVPETYYVTESYVVQESYIAQEPYTVREEYIFQEPYTIQEAYTVQESYQVNRYLDYRVIDTWTNEVVESGYGVVTYAYVTVKSLDSYSGKFMVSFTFRSRTRGQTFYDTDEFYLFSGREQTAKRRFDNWLGEDWSWTYSIQPYLLVETKYKNVTKYKDVVKYRSVTKYRDITKYRPITRYKDVIKERQVEKERLVWKPFTATRYKDVSILEYLTR